MNLFVDYVQPLTNWLEANPHWSLLITYLIALTESLAIVGSIVPGSVTMTAIGILAGAGIMRIDLTLLAAILGAVSGDGLSYALGYFYSEQISDMWPFRKYPTWLTYGKDFFKRHGGKSVFLGRFVGPLRSIIPVIAGIMHMSHWRFFIANFSSAIGWSLLYVMPGVVIGAASHELSAESATRLFVLILLFLVCVWLFSLLIKWILIKLNSYFKKNFHEFWLELKDHPILFRFVNAITPRGEENHYPTVILLLLIAINLVCFITLVLLTLKMPLLSYLNVPVYLFLQSFRSDLLEGFFIVCVQLTSTLSIIMLYLTCCFWGIYHKKINIIAYITSILITSTALAFLLGYFVYSPRPQGLLVTMPGSSFLASNLEVATALYCFIVLYIKNNYALMTNGIRTFVIVTLGLAGLGAMYLGDYWLTDILASFTCGLVLALVHYLIYRRNASNSTKSQQYLIVICSMLTIFLLSASLSTYLNFKRLVHNHTVYHKEYTLNEGEWWDQSQPILPIYRLNRIGKRTSLLNIQYLGNLEVLENSLKRYGWESHNESFLLNIMTRISRNPSTIKMPILALLFENKKPELIMTYHKNASEPFFELRIWESNFYVATANKPIWIGSLHLSKSTISKKSTDSQSINELSYLIPALNKFTLRKIRLKKENIKIIPIPSSPEILLIKY